MLDDDILKALRASKKPIKAAEIADRLGIQRKEVNRVLYNSPKFDDLAEVDENGYWILSEKVNKTEIVFPKQTISAEAYFSPRDRCKEIICKEISRAKKYVKIQAFTFHCPLITREMIKRKKDKKSNLDISIIAWNTGIAWSKRKKESVDNIVNDELFSLFKAGVKLYHDENFNHNKYMIIDGEVVLTGSMNFNRGSEFNRENIVIMRNKIMAEKFEEDWNLAKKESELIKKID